MLDTTSIDSEYKHSLKKLKLAALLKTRTVLITAYVLSNSTCEPVPHSSGNK
jgi:hypothetical protein